MQWIQGASGWDTGSENKGDSIIHDGVGHTISGQIMPQVDFTVGTRITETIVTRISSILNAQKSGVPF